MINERRLDRIISKNISRALNEGMMNRMRGAWNGFVNGGNNQSYQANPYPAGNNGQQQQQEQRERTTAAAATTAAAVWLCAAGQEWQVPVHAGQRRRQQPEPVTGCVQQLIPDVLPVCQCPDGEDVPVHRAGELQTSLRLESWEPWTT